MDYPLNDIGRKRLACNVLEFREKTESLMNAKNGKIKNVAGSV
jgi:hypothetical protein